MEKKYVVPEGMMKAAQSVGTTGWDNGYLDRVLQAALGWLDGEMERMLTLDPDSDYDLAIKDVRRMFFALRPRFLKR